LALDKNHRSFWIGGGVLNAIEVFERGLGQIAEELV